MKTPTLILTMALSLTTIAGTSNAQDRERQGNRFGNPQGQGGPGGDRFGRGQGGRGQEGQGGGRFGGRGGFRPPTPPVFAALDKDNDGTLSEAEIKNAVAAIKALDKNKDGKISQDEVMPQFGGPGGRGGFRGPGGQGRGGSGGPGGPGGQGRGGFGGPAGQGRGGFGGPGGQGGQGMQRGGSTQFNFADRIMGYDENKDGKVSKDELPSRMQRLMDRGDQDKDGFIDKSEAQKLSDAMSGGRGGQQRGGGSPGVQGNTRPQRPAFDN